MTDLIDRQELLKHKGNCYDEEGHLLYAVGTGTILLMPTVDAVPVVRCKECRNYIEGRQYCYNDIPSEPNGFCSWGERREDKRLVMPPADGSTIPQEYWGERRKDETD